MRLMIVSNDNDNGDDNDGDENDQMNVKMI